MIPQAKTPPTAGKTLQKFLLYLILINFMLMGLYILYMDGLGLATNMLLSALLILYNLLLCRLVCLRARRAGDGYIIYPVVGVSIVLCTLILYRFIISP